MAKHKWNFVGKTTPCNRSKVTQNGMWKLSLEDDKALTHTVLILNKLLTP